MATGFFSRPSRVVFGILLPVYIHGSSTMAVNTTSACNAASFSSLSLGNYTQIVSLDVTAYTNYTISATDLSPTSHTTVSAADICFLTINYTHVGDGDLVTTWVGLPLEAASWNGRYLMNGGSGMQAGDQGRAASAVASGFSTASTNAGHDGGAADPPDWALWSNGSLNWPAIEDFGSRALIEAVQLGKRATELYFGQKPKFSYWNGCSTGGRQGHFLAQQIPDEFDGILAGSPAISWPRSYAVSAWGFVKASIYGIAPPACAFNAFTSAAVDACDELDGVEDGVIALPALCHFDPSSIVGNTVDCSDLGSNVSVTITDDMANLVRDLWTGPKSPSNQSLWYGLNYDAILSGTYSEYGLTSFCSSAVECILYVNPLVQEWIQTFIDQVDANLNFSLTLDEFYSGYDKSVAEYTSILSDDDPDLTQLKESGAKMLVWHGLKDQLFPPEGTVSYYDTAVETTDADGIHDYYRLFLAPGVEHCGGGPGLDPSSDAFFELMSWVENGTAPDTIVGTGPAVGPDNTTATRTLDLCLYPKTLTFEGTDPNDASSFACV